MATGGKHFVLVHGACHGAWCWYRLAAVLRSTGNRVTTLDLGGCGVDPRRLDEIASVFDYVQPLMDFMDSVPHDEDQVVLVGHSYGGLVISLAMERFPEKISVGVFISAYMPNYEQPPAILIQEYFKRTSVESFMDTQLSFAEGFEKPPTSAIFGPDYMANCLYSRCQREDLELAKMLVRPTKLFVEDMDQKSLLTGGRFGSVGRVFVFCKEDEVMSEEFQQWMVENSPPQQVECIEGAGHMVMLSKPKELSLCLQQIAAKHHVKIVNKQ
ncbi:hypothetical protein NMG60_11026111 [Bertholletia excelsa]